MLLMAQHTMGMLHDVFGRYLTLADSMSDICQAYCRSGTQPIVSSSVKGCAPVEVGQ